MSQPMSFEIEAKLKVNSLQEVESRLRQLGAEFLAEQVQTDYHFDDANGTLAKTDRCLRLRRQRSGENEQFFLTFKGPKEKSNFKKRQEIEIEIKDADSMQKLLTALGYEAALSVEKKRQLWKFGGCEVALDELPLLGNFVEIEGPGDEEITNTQESLGLADLSHIAKSYACLMKEKLCQRNA
jgi:adenylate cyclase class 2